LRIAEHQSLIGKKKKKKKKETRNLHSDIYRLHHIKAKCSLGINPKITQLYLRESIQFDQIYRQVTRSTFTDVVTFHTKMTRTCLIDYVISTDNWKYKGNKFI